MFEFLAALVLAFSLATGDPPLPGGGGTGDPPVPGGGASVQAANDPPIVVSGGGGG
jgi:hypothetical protein